MKVLFVSSGNSGKITPIVKAQADSLEAMGIDINYFMIQGKGIWGYIKNIPKLRKYLRNSNYDIVHAHYSLSAYVASLAGSKPLVVSLMGSDVKGKGVLSQVVNLFARNFWDVTIVKSADMKKALGIKSIHVIPNGVNLNMFTPMNKLECQKKIEWDHESLHLLFAANPKRPVKNFDLFKKAFDLLQEKKNQRLHYHVLNNISHKMISVYMNAADVVCLTSKWEGSPNVIKESMVCNRPTVATNVGDISWLFGDEKGYYLCGFNPENVASKIEEALDFAENIGQTKGRNRIISMGLDSETIAKKIKTLYQNVLK